MERLTGRSPEEPVVFGAEAAVVPPVVVSFIDPFTTGRQAQRRRPRDWKVAPISVQGSVLSISKRAGIGIVPSPSKSTPWRAAGRSQRPARVGQRCSLANEEGATSIEFGVLACVTALVVVAFVGSGLSPGSIYRNIGAVYGLAVGGDEEHGLRPSLSIRSLRYRPY